MVFDDENSVEIAQSLSFWCCECNNSMTVEHPTPITLPLPEKHSFSEMDWYEGPTDGSDDGIDDEDGGESDEEEGFVVRREP